MGVYGLEKEERTSVEEIFNNLPQLEVADRYRKALQDMTDRACDELTSYMQDEYILRFEDIAYRKAMQLVQSLLRGENLESFGLKLREVWNQPGEFFAYDGENDRL